jgi:P-type Cu+ transporter
MDGTASRTARCSVLGLTCADCSLQVETRLRSLDGLISAQVSCLTHEAVIEYDPTRLSSPSVLVDTINSTGFKARLLDDEDTAAVAGSANSSTSDELVMRVRVEYDCGADGDVPESSLLLSSSSSLSSGRQRPQECQVILESIPGVLSVTEFEWKRSKKTNSTALANIVDRSRASTRSFVCEVNVKYHAAVTGPRAVLAALQSLGMRPHVLSARESAIVHDASDEWRMRALVGVILVIPIILIAFVIPDGLLSTRVEDAFDTQLVPRRDGLSVRALVCLILGLPIQFYVGAPLYTSAWRAARFMRNANMDTLVVLSSSIAWLLSVAIIVAKLAGAELEGGWMGGRVCVCVLACTYTAAPPPVTHSLCAVCASRSLVNHAQTAISSKLLLCSLPSSQLDDGLNRQAKRRRARVCNS